MPDSRAVEVHGLTKRYGAVTAVSDVSFTAGAGRVLALLGPNGAGKTTTVETCEGYRSPDAGYVRVLGLDPVREHSRLAPLIGVMLQRGGVYPSARPLEMLGLLASFAANPLDPGGLVDRLGLRGSVATPYRRLSGGQQQRLSLALAVVGRPAVVFLDEPTAGLDPAARLATWDLVRELRVDDVTVVLTTHDMDEAAELADDVVIVDGGRVVAAGTPTALTGAGQDARVTFGAPGGLDLAALGEALPPSASVTEPEPGRYVVAGPVDPALLSAVAVWCARHGVLAENLAIRRRTLEDVFLELTGRELRS